MKKEIVYDFNDPSWVTNLNDMKPSKNKIVLTIDDGPGKYTIEILDILKVYNVRAVFFWQSRLVYDKRPWRRLLSEGHLLGSHSHNHKNLIHLCKEEQLAHIRASKNILEKVTGQEIEFFRPPYGRYNEDTIEVLSELKLKPVMWEISSYDWELKDQPDQIVSNVVNHVKSGSIVLLHELEQTVRALPSIIEEVRNRGFDFDIF